MNGIILINKEEGYTSRDVVNMVSKKLQIKKVGHAGTLDPLATGLLVLGVGKATKILDLLTLDTKEYIATVKMGLATDTLDITGKVIHEKENFLVSNEEIQEVLKKFLGTYSQTVPKYSAVKIKGKKLYEYARSEKEVVLPKRNVTIYSLSLLEYDIKKQEFTFKTLVSKGTYIRSLISDIGNCLGIPCTMKKLVRTKSGKFNIQDSVKIDGNFKLIPIKEALDFPIYQIDNLDLLKKVKNGNSVYLKNISEPIILFIDSNQQEIAIYKKLTIHNYKAFKVF